MRDERSIMRKLMEKVTEIEDYSQFYDQFDELPRDHYDEFLDGLGRIVTLKGGGRSLRFETDLGLDEFKNQLTSLMRNLDWEPQAEEWFPGSPDSEDGSMKFYINHIIDSNNYQMMIDYGNKTISIV